MFVYLALLQDASLYEALWNLDQELAAKARAQGCPCGGRLHSANYPRKPRGGPANLDPAYDLRLSFCCAEEGCRRRITPPSVRFLGRRVYLGVAVVLVSALRAGMAERHLDRLHRYLNVDTRTLKRWLQWWRQQMPQSTFWQAAMGRLLPPIDITTLPASLLARFNATADPPAALIALLRFLSPLSTGPMVAQNKGGSRPAEDAD
jgi:hypothetical protein